MAIQFVSAYRQLSAVEKSFVDDYVSALERESERTNRRISDFIGKSIEITDENQLLSRPMVAAAITERLTKIAADRELNPSRIIKEYINMAFSNLNDYMQLDEWGNPVYDLTRCTPDQLSAVKKLKFERNATGSERLEFELYDKKGALDTLAKMVGLLEPDNTLVRSEMSAVVIDSTATTQDAAEAYARMLSE